MGGVREAEEHDNKKKSKDGHMHTRDEAWAYVAARADTLYIPCMDTMTSDELAESS